MVSISIYSLTISTKQKAKVGKYIYLVPWIARWLVTDEVGNMRPLRTMT